MDPAELPYDVLELCLQHASLEQRLGPAALVQRHWQLAAATATQNIKLCDLTPERCNDMLTWLSKYGQDVTSLDLTGADTQQPKLYYLPCPQLYKLDLYRLQLQLAPSSHHEGVLHGCTRLQQIDISCTVLDSLDGLAALAGLTHLQCLSLYGLEREADDSGTGGMELEVPGSFPSGLVQLTSLQLDVVEQEHHQLDLMGLTKLRSLQIHHLGAPQSSEDLLGLGQLQQLTEFRIFSATNAAFSTRETPGLSQLTGLRFLQLPPSYLEVAALADLKLLPRLDLRDAWIDDYQDCQLLEWLPQLQHLSYLDLTGSLRVPSLDASDCSALTSSSQLQHLPSQ